MTEKAIIPPVTAGTINSSIDIEYGSSLDNYYCEATSVHSWQFDGMAYGKQTGLDIGANYPYVAQENGHALRIVTDFQVHQSTNGEAYTVFVERKAVRGRTRYERIFWTECGYYDLEYTEKGLEVTNTGQDQQPYRQRESDEDIEHHRLFNHEGHYYDSLNEFLYELHGGNVGITIFNQLQTIIEMDSPDEAVYHDEVEPQSFKNQQPATSD